MFLNLSVLYLGCLNVLEVLSEYVVSVFNSGKSGCNLWFAWVFYNFFEEFVAHSLTSLFKN